MKVFINDIFVVPSGYPGFRMFHDKELVSPFVIMNRTFGEYKYDDWYCNLKQIFISTQTILKCNYVVL